MQIEGYWFRNNKLFRLENGNHISYIIKYPHKFDLTKEYIVSVYEKHDEKIGTEGKAREELIKLVAKDGWIRVRHYMRPDYWSIQFDKFKLRECELHSLIEYLILIEKVMYMNDDVLFVGYEDISSVAYEYKSGGIKPFLLNEKFQRKINKIIEVTNFKEM